MPSQGVVRRIAVEEGHGDVVAGRHAEQQLEQLQRRVRLPGLDKNLGAPAMAAVAATAFVERGTNSMAWRASRIASCLRPRPAHARPGAVRMLATADEAAVARWTSG
jgi:hypothetical protein